MELLLFRHLYCATKKFTSFPPKLADILGYIYAFRYLSDPKGYVNKEQRNVGNWYQDKLREWCGALPLKKCKNIAMQLSIESPKLTDKIKKKNILKAASFQNYVFWVIFCIDLGNNWALKSLKIRIYRKTDGDDFWICSTPKLWSSPLKWFFNQYLGNVWYEICSDWTEERNSLTQRIGQSYEDLQPKCKSIRWTLTLYIWLFICSYITQKWLHQLGWHFT